jgi:hypothetical protein
MATRKIDREQWATFLPEFTRQHDGRMVHLSFFGPGTGSHEDPHELHLIDIALHDPDSDQERITVRVGTAPHQVVTRTVELPVQVWIKAGDDEVDEVLEIRSDHGQVIMVRFRIGAPTARRSGS